jgi:hypothetical protein
MRKLIFPYIALAFIVLFTGCSTKFNIGAPYKNITVIYAYLDLNDTAHYIRIQKAFLDQSKSALSMSQTPDSSFYANLNVKIKRMDYTDTNLIDTIHLNRVDLNNEGYPKQAGVFFNSPNYAYKFKNTLSPYYIYRIIVTNLTTGQIDSAEAPIIDDSNDGNFTSNYFFSDTGKLEFSSTLPNANFDLFCEYTPTAGFAFESLTSPAVIAQTIFTFNWVDSDITNQKLTGHSCTFDAGYQTLNTNSNIIQIFYKIPNISFYSALSSGMGPAPTNQIRLLGKVNLSVYLGTQDFLNYQNNSLTQGIGLTGSEIEPVYTNVKGLDALGLFTSRGLQTGILNITDQTLDSLKISPLMTQNNIKGRAQ